MNKQKIVICGLGNIGIDFQKTRHNIGSDFLLFMSQKYDLIWQENNHCRWIIKKIGNFECYFIILKTYMNTSGLILKKAVKSLKITNYELLIIVDNLDLPLGKWKLQSRIPNNGHNGLQNIKENLTNVELYVLHLGIDRQNPIQSWVLKPFTKEEWIFLITNFFEKLLNKGKINLFSCQNFKGAIMNLNQTKKNLSNVKRPNRHLAVIGAQWGDEGKGKIVDYIVSKNMYQAVARFSGGDNAGHTIIVGNDKYYFSVLPVSIIQSDKVSIIGAGCVLNLEQLIKELRWLKNKRFSINLKISGRCHLIMPYHIALDIAEEKNRRSNRIGTTKRGIGPCWQDRVGRSGIILNMLFNANLFAERIEQALQYKNILLSHVYHDKKITPQIIIADYLTLFAEIREYIFDDLDYCQNEGGKHNFVFEGAQGALLDNNFGTYPFVTSSSTTSWQIGNSFGDMIRFTKILGVFKAYNSRVGTGPFPTEISIISDINSHMVKNGNEFGVVTKRRRRVGWFDVLLAKYACQINGFDEIAITLLDVLSGLEEIKLCIGYRIQDKLYQRYDSKFGFEEDIICEYLTLPGWKEPLTSLTKYEQLPKNAKIYLDKIEELLGLKIKFISVGPKRDQIIIKS